MRLVHLGLLLFINWVNSIQAEELISPASQWQYYDLAASPPLDWFTKDFDSSQWQTGKAQFGYGENDEATVTAFGNDPENKTLVQYFRRTFVIQNLSDIGEPKLRILVDDGAVVYINGIEAYRVNLTKDTDHTLRSEHQTLATDSLIEYVWQEVPFDFSLLQQGENSIAVAVHQLSPNSSDISFDLAISYTLAKESIENESTQTHLLSSGETKQLTLLEPNSYSNIYRLNIPEGISELTISTSEGRGDADLLVLFDGIPSLNKWDERPSIGGNNETVIFRQPQPGSYFVRLFAVRPFADVKLTASW
ncbi:PPC domain-containing protein [Aliikangiella coralliicola]|uniref:Peptidase C-terminal archaeal/bacterial domain-containing protein n=1 Tax=Aliikangiella coralliicola TaxID=2592383 RepID=A0A545UJ89_9GAMM|nr:PPC domain-containing protein [Aliikangiella coralliicola]TQV89525.1 hypothetical protein FLL46_01180 [Aliikangiella coralliicola]